MVGVDFCFYVFMSDVGRQVAAFFDIKTKRHMGGVDFMFLCLYV